MSEDRGRVITVAIYTHPEYYPPVLNTIDELSGIFETVQIISRNLKSGHWDYPSNAKLFLSGDYVSIRDSEHAPTNWKIKSFLKFTRDFYRTLKKNRSEWVMCNDPISLFSFRMIRPFLGYEIKLWYHSHDVSEPGLMRKYSVGYFAVKSEPKYFNRIDLFTLPAESRISYFPIEKLKGKWLLIPNYPSKRRVSGIRSAGWPEGKNLKLIYQGRISNEHGLEEILEYVKADDRLNLTMIGPGDEIFIRKLKNKTLELSIDNRVEILDPVPYAELAVITANHQVGLAVNKPMNILYRTAAMASNKIYEYAAVGLPILYYKDEHYLKYLGRFSWALPTDLTLSDLSSVLQVIRTNFPALSEKAALDFKDTLNFESAFKPVRSFLE